MFSLLSSSFDLCARSAGVHVPATPAPCNPFLSYVWLELAGPLRWLDEAAVEDIATGATVLGTGGGGDPYIGKLMAIDAIAEHGPVRLLEPNEVADADLIVPTAMMGAPTVMLEKIPRGDEILDALHALERRLGGPTKATMSIEAGGINSTIPITVAARLRLPLVDCDGMGRAFPEIQMVTMTMHGIRATPMAMADEKGNFVVLDTIDNRWTERISRMVTVTMGGSAVIALYPLTGAQLKQATVHGSLSLAQRIGRTLREARGRKAEPIAAMLRVTDGFLVFKGKVTDVLRRTVAGFAKGEAHLAGLEEYDGQSFMLHFQNENLVGMLDGQITVSVPDLITTVDLETGFPITTETLRYGMRTAIVGIPCSPLWRTPQALEIIGPRYFGYDIEYEPIERRMRR